MYKGFGVTLLRDVPGSMIYFGVYEIINRRFDSNPYTTLFAGGFAGASNWLFMIPIDAIKTNIQTDRANNIKEGFYYIYNHKGIHGFYSGLVPSISRAFISNAFCFLAVEYSLKAMNSWF